MTAITPKAFANWSPGFPTLGHKGPIHSYTPKVLANGVGVVRIYGIRHPRVENPGLELANTFGLKI